jgi:hypothetical protein
MSNVKFNFIYSNMIKNLDPHHQANNYNWEGVMEFLYVMEIDYLRTNIKIAHKKKIYGHYKETHSKNMSKN